MAISKTIQYAVPVACFIIAIMLACGWKGYRIGLQYRVKDDFRAGLVGFFLGPIGWWIIRNKLERRTPSIRDKAALMDIRKRAVDAIWSISDRTKLADPEKPDSKE